MPVVDEFKDVKKKYEISAQAGDPDNFTGLSIKEVLDKIGFGFSSQQFINILLFQTGASIFLIGLINALRVVFGNLTYFFIEKFRSLVLNKRIISLGGITFGFSFLLVATAIFMNSLLLFSLAVLISSVSVVFYGEAKNLFRLSPGKAVLSERITKYSLIITALSLFLAAYLMDAFPVSGGQVILTAFNSLVSFKLYGYLIVFEIAAISFILAGYILSHAKDRAEMAEKQPQASFGFFLNNKALLLLIAANIAISIVQITGYSYYGIFIFQNFKDVMFGGFLNVAMVFLISVFTSLIGYTIIKLNAKVYRKFPILIFGAILVAFMPFAYYFREDLVFLTVGTIIGVICSSAFGVANSLLSIELIGHDMRQAYFSFTNLVSIPFLLIGVPAMAYVGQIFGLSTLFLILTIISLTTIIVLFIAYLLLRKELA